MRALEEHAAGLLSNAQYRWALERAREYGQGDPVSERCGLIGTRSNGEVDFAAITNCAVSAGDQFSMHNEDIVIATDILGLSAIVTWWHSHPSGKGPSLLDWEMLRDVGALYGCTTGVVSSTAPGRHMYIYLYHTAEGDMLVRELP